jgi:hypothetical protein
MPLGGILEIIQMFVPVVTYFVNALGSKALNMMARVFYTFISAQAIAPMALALLPGIKAGASQCKLMIPQSALFGWIMWVVPIFYVPIIAVFYLMALQLLSSPWLTACTVLFGASQLYPFLMGRGIVKVYRDAEHYRTSTVMKNVGRTATILKYMSTLCLVGYAVEIGADVESMLVTIVKNRLNPKRLMFMVLGCAKGYLLTTVLASDALLHLTFSMHSEEQSSPVAVQEMKDTISRGRQALVPGSFPPPQPGSSRVAASNAPEIEMGALPAQTVAAVLSAGVMDEEKVGASSLAALVECQHETV